MKLLEHTLWVDTDYPTVTLIPFGCVHADDQGFSEETFRDCIQTIKNTPNCLAIGLGDYNNFLRTTARKHLRSYVADEDSFRDLDQMVRREGAVYVKKWLEPIKHKLIGLGEGNHLYEFSTGGTDTQYMCQLLGVPYLDKPAFIRLIIRNRKSKKTLKILKILAHHGDWSGGYSRAGGDINSAELKALGFDFDIYLFSHTHRLYGMHIPSLTIPSQGLLRLVERQRAFIRTGCFMRGYVEGCVGRYASKKLLNPTAIGFVQLFIKLVKKYSHHRYEENKKIIGISKSRARQSAYDPLTHKFEVKY